ncbi:hypothetical protein APASM_6569 [Actinosynnema pretiosum subsp. pretiosum]|nr:hypothetical protein APASM_6569 [Actinosynnema pretiosum subsp. pretiosum]
MPLPEGPEHHWRDVKFTQSGLALHGSNFTTHHNSAARVATDPSACTVDVHGQGSNAVRLG